MAQVGGIRNILFDLDGTLLDSRPGIVAGLRQSLLQLGHDLTADLSLDWAIGPPLLEVMKRLLAPFNDPRVEQAVNLYREWYGSVGLYDARTYPGVTESLDKLRERGASLFVATSKRTAFAVRVLNHFGLAEQFLRIRGAEPHGRFDSKIDLVRDLLETEGLAAAQTVLVGDRAHDMAAARANGLRVVAVTYGYGSREELAGADIRCDCAADLAGLV